MTEGLIARLSEVRFKPTDLGGAVATLLAARQNDKG